MLTLLLGRAGSGKTQTVLSRLEELARAGHHKLILLVPEQYSFMSERELLTRLGVRLANCVMVVSFTRLAETVLRDAGGLAQPPLDDGARALLMSRALAEVAAAAEANGETLLGAHPRQMTDAAYVEQMLDLWEEMRVCAVSTDDLQRAQEELSAEQTAAAQLLQQKVGDYHRVFAAYEGLVASCGMEDTDVLTRAARCLSDSSLPDGAEVLVDGFKGFTAQELTILEQLISRAEGMTLTLCTDTAGVKNGAPAGTTVRENTLFSPVTVTVGRLQELAARHGKQWTVMQLEENRRHSSAALRALEAGLYHPAPAVYAQPAAEVTVTPCFDVYEECAYVARQIRRLMREEGVRCRDITVVARDVSVYSGLLEDALDAVGVPHSLDARQVIIDEPLVVYIRAALRIAVGGWHTESILRLLKTDLSILSPLDTARLENYVYLWNIEGAAWIQDWTENPDGLGKVVSASSARALAELNRLRRQVVTPLIRLREALHGGVNGRAFALAVYRFLTEDKELASRLASRVDLLETMAEARLAERAARVWDETMALLDRFAAVLGEYSMPAVRLEELFTMLAQLVDMGQLPQGLDAVMVGAADRIRYHRPRVVFVLGANEGVLPAYPQENMLFSEDEREALLQHNVRLDDDMLTHCIEERYYAYTALTAAQERLFVSYHTAGDCVASPLIAAIRTILPQHTEACARAADGRDAETAPEMFARLAESYARHTPVVESLRQVLADKPVYAARLKAVSRAAASEPFCLEQEETAAALFGRDMRLSASQTEQFYKCRFSYFCKYGLQLKQRQRATVDAASFGTIVHYVMETLLPQYTAQGSLVDTLKAQDAARDGMDKAAQEQAENATQAMLVDTLSSAVHHTVMAYVDEKMGTIRGKSAQFLYHIELAERSAYNMLWHTIMEFRQSAFRPVAFELNIQAADEADVAQDALPAIHLAFERGSIRLAGKVDRVDLYVRFDGKAYVRVIDYKTGSKTFNLHEVSCGLNTQMLLYLFNICDYPQRVAKTDALAPAGVLYHPLSDLAVPRGKGDNVMQKRLESMRMNGLVLDDASVVQAMEQKAAKTFIPVKLNAGGQPIGDVATAQHFQLLRGVIEQLLVQMANELLDGDIAAMPIKETPNSMCVYCDYAAICARDEDAPENDIGKRKAAEVLKALEAADEEVSDRG